MPIALAILERLKANDPTFTTLSLRYQNLNVHDFERLAAALQHNTSLTSLDITGNPVDDKGAMILAKMGSHLTSLTAVGIQMENQGAKTLAQHLKLRHLDLSQNPIESEGMREYANNAVLTSLSLAGTRVNSQGAQLLAQNTTLTYLNLTETLLHNEGAISLALIQTLTTLVLTGNQLGDNSAIVLAQHPNLRVLRLCYNNMGTPGAKAFANNTRLKSLNLNYNMIGVEGAIALSANISLEELHVGGNRINHKGVVALAQSTTLLVLDLSYNQMDDEVSEIFKTNHTLTELNMSHNILSHKMASALAGISTLRKLAIGHNLLGDDGAAALAQSRHITWLDTTNNQIGPLGAQALAQNAQLQTLIISNNLIGDVGAVSLSYNHALIDLLLSYNQISDAGAFALAQNPTLKTLTLNYNQISEKGRQALRKNTSITNLQISIEQPPQFTSENLSTIFQLSQDYLCIRSDNDIIQFFNPAFSRALGYIDDELLGKPFIDLLHPEDRLEVVHYEMPEYNRKKFPLTEEYNRCRCKDDSYRFIRWSSQIKHQRVYTVGTDVTSQKQMDDKLHKIEATSALATAHAKASELFSQKQAVFIAHLCHEVRNPLGGIFGNIEMLKEYVQTLLQTPGIPAASLPELNSKLGKITDCVKDIETCAEHQSMILNDNLDISKLTDNKLQLEYKPLMLIALIKDTYHMLKVNAEKKGLALKLNLPDNEAIIKGDMSRIKQILLNLISNAIKFTAQGSIETTLYIHKKTSEYTEFELSVSDTGIGLNEQELERLFQRFSQANASVGSQYGGSGLGLYIAKSIAQLMKGDITIESQKGKGTTFHWFFQCENATDFEVLQLEQAMHEKEDIACKLSSPVKILPFFQQPVASKKSTTKVLIVDDNEINRKIVNFALTKAGYDCDFAIDGKEALDKYIKNSYNIIIMDIVMPNMDGIEATREIRRLERVNKSNRVPIIALTGNALDAQRQIAIEAGMDDYIAKPYKREILLEKVAAYLNSQKGAEMQNLTNPNVSIRM